MEILYKNESHTIPERIINDLKKFGIEFNDEYIEFLLSNNHPWKFNTSLLLMAIFDLANRKFIGNNSILGRIIQLDENNNPISYFDDVYSAAIASTGNSNKYCFYMCVLSSLILYSRDYYKCLFLLLNQKS